MLPVYILIRTSNRPRFFANMMESIKNQTYGNIITIVHTDDPSDNYIEGDIIIRGTYLDRTFGSAPYNLYNNRLLETIPEGPGWYHFIDDDDMYAADDVIERMVKSSIEDHINIARVRRWGDCIWPKTWGSQESYQTECFFLHTKHKDLARWWGNKGGDHNYSKQITQVLPKNWIENLIICKAQQGKGRGNRLDLGQSERKRRETCLVPVRYLRRVRVPSSCRGHAGDLKSIPKWRAIDLQFRGRIEIIETGKAKYDEIQVVDNRTEKTIDL